MSDEREKINPACQPIRPSKFCRKASRMVFWSLSRYKELKLATKPFIGRTLRGLLIPMQNISLRSSDMRRKQNFAFPPSLFFRFCCLIFFSLAGHLVGFILVGKVFRNAFRVLGLDERKGRWVVEQDFHGNFHLNVTWCP